jgi:molecular chaperone Hsp33
LNSPSHTAPDDLVQPFRIDPFALRGRLVRLGPAIDRILSQHDYPEPVATMLGEAITLAVVLAGALKYEGIFTLQTKGDGPIRLMVADVSTTGALRGYAQYDAAKLEAALAQARMSSPSVPLLVGSGYIAFTVDQGKTPNGIRGSSSSLVRPSLNARTTTSVSPSNCRPELSCPSAGRAPAVLGAPAD